MSSKQLKNDLLGLVSKQSKNLFLEQFNILKPILDIVYNLEINTNEHRIVLGGGAACYLIGRYQNFSDIDIFIFPHNDKEQDQKPIHQYIINKSSLFRVTWTSYFSDSLIYSILEGDEIILDDGRRTKLQIIIQERFFEFDLLECSVLIPLYRKYNCPIIYLDECRCYDYHRVKRGKRSGKSIFRVIRFRNCVKFRSISPELIDSCTKVFVHRILTPWIRPHRALKYMNRNKKSWNQSFGFNFLKNYCKICKIREDLIYSTIIKWKKYVFRPYSHYFWMTIINTYYPVGIEEYVDRPGK